MTFVKPAVYLLGLCSILGGCGGALREATQMPNPLIAGCVPPNRAQAHRDHFERLYELDKGVADTEASIVSMDDSWSSC